MHATMIRYAGHATAATWTSFAISITTAAHFSHATMNLYAAGLRLVT
jgi:hypothetical protein